MITRYSMTLVLLSLLSISAYDQPQVASPITVEQIEQKLNTEIPIHTTTVFPTPALVTLTKERIGASVIGGSVILLGFALVTDFMCTNPETRAKVVPLYISAVGAIVISFLGRFCKLFPHTNNEIAAFVTGAIGSLGVYQYARSFYNK